MNCWFCGSPLIWGCDFTFEDYGYNGEGIIAVLSCSNENCGAIFEGYRGEELKEEYN